MISVLSLCSGYGGLELALADVLGPLRLIAVADVDRDASTVLAARHPGTPNLGDIKAVDWSTVERPDVLTAGYPCQPFSQAGRQRGTDDPRHLWPWIHDAVRQLRPKLVVLENVRRHLTLGFDAVLADLAEAGFDAEWCVVRASDVGAPHRRERLFVVAHPNGEPTGWLRGADAGPQGEDAGRGASHGDRPAHGAGAAADAHEAGRQRLEGCPQPGGSAVATASADGPAWAQYAPAVGRWGRILGRPAPDPFTDEGFLNARFSEWMMGLPEGWVTDLVPNWRALKLIGNGVVPQQAALALRELL